MHDDIYDHDHPENFEIKEGAGPADWRRVWVCHFGCLTTSRKLRKMGRLRASAEQEIAPYRGRSASIQGLLYRVHRIINKNEVFGILGLFGAGTCE